MFWNQEFPDMLFMDSFRFIHYVVLETPLLYPLRFLNAAYSQLKYLQPEVCTSSLYLPFCPKCTLQEINFARTRGRS